MSDTTAKLLVSPSPHVHIHDSIERNMYDVIIALIPALIASVIFFGWAPLGLTVTSIASAMFFEWIITRFVMGKKELTITDGSAIITGFLLALNVPANLPIWILFIGNFAAIALAKMPFGGLGNNIFNPAILGRVFLLVSFPKQMTIYPPAHQILAAGTDATTGATPLAIAKGVLAGSPDYSLDMLPSATEMFLGQLSGSFGEVSAIALLIGFVYLLLRKVITWHIPVSILGTAFVFSGIMWLIDPTMYMSPVLQLMTGGMLIGAIFMATDYVTSPMSTGGQILYGVMIGLITMVIRFWGSYPEGMSFAILFMNGFTPMINQYIKPRLFRK